ncbi:MAG TPA: glycosyltransferase family 4 protein [Thermoflexales bacterium]|nr:glycosyltransferase family 4 protein [Thermoflexales bacterium]HRA55286.1 glycosyltransferase family 4 protein [Thermoflexales bacterium]
MRILFICKVSPLQEYGTEIRAREVARRLAASGHDVTVICARVSPEEPAEQDWNGVRILAGYVLPHALLRRFPYPHYLPQAASSALLILHVLAHLRRERYDLIRDDMSPFPSSGLGAFFALSGAKRSLVVQHYPTTFGEARRNYGLAFGLAASFMAHCFRRGWLHYDRILAVNPYHVEIAAANPRLRARTHFSPNGVDTAQFSACVGAGDPWRMLSVGRLVPLKGHRYLIDALGMLAPHWSQLRLTILGDGPLGPELLAQAQALGVGDRLTILAGVPHAKMPQLYAEHGLFVLPSLVEGFSLALLEAMASGLPVVVSDIPAHRSTLDDRVAALFECGSAASLGSVLAGLLADVAARRGMAERGRAFAREFDWAAIARQEIENV